MAAKADIEVRVGAAVVLGYGLTGLLIEHVRCSCADCVKAGKMPERKPITTEELLARAGVRISKGAQ